MRLLQDNTARPSQAGPDQDNIALNLLVHPKETVSAHYPHLGSAANPLSAESGRRASLTAGFSAEPAAKHLVITVGKERQLFPVLGRGLYLSCFPCRRQARGKGV